MEPIIAAETAATTTPRVLGPLHFRPRRPEHLPPIGSNTGAGANASPLPGEPDAAAPSQGLSVTPVSKFILTPPTARKADSPALPTALPSIMSLPSIRSSTAAALATSPRVSNPAVPPAEGEVDDTPSSGVPLNELCVCGAAAVFECGRCGMPLPIWSSHSYPHRVKVLLLPSLPAFGLEG